MTTKPRIIIGIDPDIEASGIGIVTIDADGKVATSIGRHPLPGLVERLVHFKAGQDADARFGDSVPDTRIYIEAGWLNQGNWHISPRDTKQVAAAKGRAAGRNHQIGIDLSDFLSHHRISHDLVRPLQKCWKGPDRKITHQELDTIIRWVNHTGMTKKRSNQEERDALLLAWVESGLPIRC